MSNSPKNEAGRESKIAKARGSAKPRHLADLARMVSGQFTDQSHVTVKGEKPSVGQNLAAHLDALSLAMRKAAENLEIEDAALLRDEVNRLVSMELAAADNPLARQSVIEDAVDETVKSRGRSTGGRSGMRGGKARRGR